MSIRVTPGEFLVRLRSRMSGYSAQLLLNSALIETGLNMNHDAELSQEEVKNLCLELIKKGGPAFHVGQAMYREHLIQ